MPQQKMFCGCQLKTYEVSIRDTLYLILPLGRQLVSTDVYIFSGQMSLYQTRSLRYNGRNRFAHVVAPGLVAGVPHRTP